MEIASNIGMVSLYIVIALLCLGGIVLSCLSISGTWIISLAAILTVFLKGDVFVGWVCVAVFLAISAVIEGLEFVAGSMGVSKKGGSKLAGLMAFLGGILGAVLGALLPIPVPGVGPLVGMFAVSFLLVYAVEYRRLKHHEQAVNIATGAVIARVAVILLKVTATMGMIIYLWAAVILKTFK